METKGIYTKLLNIQSQGVGVEKEGKNPHFKSTYMTLDSILETFGPILSKEKLVMYHETKNSILTTFIIDATDGSFISSEFAILNEDPQKRGGEITYGKRYNLGQLLNIMTDVDDDGNKSSGDNFVKQAPKTEDTREWLNDKDFDKKIVDWCSAFTTKQQFTDYANEVKQTYRLSKVMQEKLKVWFEDAISDLS